MVVSLLHVLKKIDWIDCNSPAEGIQNDLVELYLSEQGFYELPEVWIGSCDLAILIQMNV